MKVLHVIPTIDLVDGGPVEGLMQLSICYDNAGIKLDVVCADTSNQKAAIIGNVYHFKSWLGRYGFSLSMFIWLFKNLKSYDLVVVDGLWGFGGASVYLCSIMRRKTFKYYVFTHGMLDPWFKRRYPNKYYKKLLYWFLVQRKVLSEADSVLYTCEEEKQLARNTFPFYSPKKEVVVGYGTSLPEGNFVSARKELLARWGDFEGRSVVVFLGRLHEKKGCDLLLHGFSELVKHFPDYELLIIGDGDHSYIENLKTLAHSLSIDERVTWAGLLTGDSKWAAMSIGDVMCLPSHQENFGVVVAEFVGLGVPVLVSDKVNIWREIESYNAGLVFSDTKSGVAQSLIKFAGLHSDIKAEMSRSATRLFSDKFKMSVVAENIMALYDE